MSIFITAPCWCFSFTCSFSLCFNNPINTWEFWPKHSLRHNVKPVIEFLLSLDNFINYISIICSWNLRMMSEKLFSNHGHRGHSGHRGGDNSASPECGYNFQCNLCSNLHYYAMKLFNVQTMSQADKMEKLQEDAAACYEHMSQGIKSWPESLGCKPSVSRMHLWLWLKLYWISGQLGGCWVWPNSWKWQKKLYTKI